ncbi:general secretion pathway protein GspK [Chromatium okenii]|uniref:General secretion pathway protein GspK n=1 Tax=Chromatium okenii TaxID=61644 RepID=A0A2S7XT23_9GAMM|nr:type II secretion system protein GspK [Chromatium okenii]PQJ96561.1 general secretion pathway protein GspK [Chromatium okenii]
MNTPISPPQRQRGIALMLVLWVLTLLTVMAVSMTATQRTELALTDHQLAETRWRLASDAALAYTAWQLSQPLPIVEMAEATGVGADDADALLTTEWLPDGAAHEWTFADSSMTIAVFNELSRINLNQADSAQLKALLVALAVPEDDAATLADRIVDWRDPDHLAQLNGAEDDDYQAAGAVFGAKDEPFIAIDELRQVLGITATLYQQLAPELTLAGEGKNVEMEFASATVLAATQGISLEDAQLQQLEQQTPRHQNRGGPLYRVVITASAALTPAPSSTQRMEAVLELTPNQELPYVVHWRRFGGRDAASESTLHDESR